MRLATVDGRLSIGTLDVARASGGRFSPDPMDALERWDEFLDWSASRAADDQEAEGQEADDHEAEGQEAEDTVDTTRLGPPVPRPRQVFALALNYPPHAAEAGFQPPAEPLVFTKFPSCIAGPYATVSLPSDRVDWEVELVAVIGRRAYRVSESDAWGHVAGLTVGQDLSERRVQLAGSPPQFSLGKSYPGFGPTGPVLVTPGELADPDDLEISCTVSGTLTQHARTGQMIFPVPEIVARLSTVCPLLPGDLIFTGTPAGVGNRMTPPRYLGPGDVVVSRVEGIGEIRTYCEACSSTSLATASGFSSGSQ